MSQAWARDSLRTHQPRWLGHQSSRSARTGPSPRVRCCSARSPPGSPSSALTAAPISEPAIGQAAPWGRRKWRTPEFKKRARGRHSAPRRLRTWRSGGRRAVRRLVSRIWGPVGPCWCPGAGGETCRRPRGTHPSERLCLLRPQWPPRSTPPGLWVYKDRKSVV